MARLEIERGHALTVAARVGAADLQRLSFDHLDEPVDAAALSRAHGHVEAQIRGFEGEVGSSALDGLGYGDRLEHRVERRAAIARTQLRVRAVFIELEQPSFITGRSLETVEIDLLCAIEQLHRLVVLAELCIGVGEGGQKVDVRILAAGGGAPAVEHFESCGDVVTKMVGANEVEQYARVLTRARAEHACRVGEQRLELRHCVFDITASRSYTRLGNARVAHEPVIASELRLGPCTKIAHQLTRAVEVADLLSKHHETDDGPDAEG